MGLAIPRPAMRRREARWIEKRMAEHFKLMKAFEAEGMSPAEASRKAYDIVTAKKRRNLFPE